MECKSRAITGSYSTAQRKTYEMLHKIIENLKEIHPMKLIMK